jgi:hypothetical protein
MSAESARAAPRCVAIAARASRVAMLSAARMAGAGEQVAA